jgi:hypothetical protein
MPREERAPCVRAARAFTLPLCPSGASPPQRTCRFTWFAFW